MGLLLFSGGGVVWLLLGDGVFSVGVGLFAGLE